MRHLRARTKGLGRASFSVTRAWDLSPSAGHNLGTTSGTIKVDNPYTGETYCDVPRFDQAEVMARADKAKVAQSVWANTPLSERIAVCERMVDAFHANAEIVSRDISGMMGRPFAQIQGEINGLEERTRGMISQAEQALADEVLTEKPNFVRKIVKEPVGTVFVVAPWNYPLLTSVNTIIPAVLAGNAVMIKQSSRTPLCANHFAEAFAAAGAPQDLVQVANCSHDTTSSLIASGKIDFVSFTGSVSGGQQIYSQVGSHTFIDTTLELGGKDPAYVAADADIDAAAATLVDGAFYNAGQCCCGIERVYVDRSQYENFLSKAQELVDAYVLGDPLDPGTTMGPLASPSAAGFLSAQVEDAVSKGALLLSGGTGVTDAAGKGRFFAPTLLADCTHDMDVMVEESFGPILGVAAVDSEQEAVELMNDSEYGLTAVIFTSSADTAARMGPKLQTGTVFMNRCDYLDPELPWTGVKDTGKGASLSHHGFKGVTRLKSYHFKLDPNA